MKRETKKSSNFPSKSQEHDKNYLAFKFISLTRSSTIIEYIFNRFLFSKRSVNKKLLNMYSIIVDERDTYQHWFSEVFIFNRCFITSFLQYVYLFRDPWIGWIWKNWSANRHWLRSTFLVLNVNHLIIVVVEFKPEWRLGASKVL